MPVIMGTAGHIDHGKTTLVKALTGIDTDRLAEEKCRGITIELGFAHMDLPGGERVGIIDMPGHERFVKNMVSGASGVDFVLLVIAADEGVMPQTREHLDICTLLGVDKGMVALTKVDMVDEEWLQLMQEELGGFFAGTFLEGAPIMPVSAKSGQGVDELQAEIAKLVKGLQPRRRTDLARLPVDRVFSMHGHGTVVTGTLISGSLSVGEDVIIYPKELAAKIRGLQSHGETVDTAPAGLRTAVNLHGPSKDEIHRGEVLARPGTLIPSRAFDVELSYLASAPIPLKHRKEVHFHHGARELPAKIYLHDREALEPGDTAVCRFLFPEPLVGVAGDRIVIRSFSPLRTIAGGRIISPVIRRVKRFAEDGIAALQTLAQGEPEDVVATTLDLAGFAGADFNELMLCANLQSKALDKVLSKLSSQGRALLIDKDAKRWVSGLMVQELSASVLAFLKDFHAKDPMRQGAPAGEVASAPAIAGQRASERFFRFVLDRLTSKGEIVAEGEVLRLPGHKVSLAADQTKLKEALEGAYIGTGLTPPNIKEVLEPLGVSVKEAAAVLSMLVKSGSFVKVDELYFEASAVDGLKEKVTAFLQENAEMTAPDFKDLTGLSRKYAIPLMEHLDKEKVTIRVGDKRVLRKR